MHDYDLERQKFVLVVEKKLKVDGVNIGACEDIFEDLGPIDCSLAVKVLEEVKNTLNQVRTKRKRHKR